MFDMFESRIITKTLDKKDLCNPIHIGYVKNVQQTGSFVLIVNSCSLDGPNGIYCLSRSNKDECGQITKMVSSNGALGNSIDIEWKPTEKPLLTLQYMNNDTDKRKKIVFKFKVKVLTS